MKLYQLLYGTRKDNKKPIMVDSYSKCENFMNSRKQTKGHHEIVEAPDGASRMKKSSRKKDGYISSRGFERHT